jgi:DNA-binding MarR family transcriptional regulator
MDPREAFARERYATIAKPVLDRADIFAGVAETMAKLGYAGDPAPVELLYAIFTSRLLDRPMCAFLKAPSSSGKSWLLNRTLELFPPEAYELKSGITPKAIAYGRSDLEHRILAIQEASGLQGREGNMLVRTLISEGVVRWEVAGRERDGFTTRMIERPGPIAFVMTTTRNFLHKEDETRALSIQVDDTPEHTRRVLDSIAGRYSGAEDQEGVNIAPWHAFQRWLATGPSHAVIPFAGQIARHYWAQANRSKRDFEQVLTAIGTSALMHQTRREIDDYGSVVATLDDYAMARRFLVKVLGEASGAAVPPTVRDTFQAIAACARELTGDADEVRWPSLTELAAKLGIDKAAASRRVAKAKEMGLVADRRARPGFPSRLALVERLPEDAEVLPRVEKIEMAEANLRKDTTGAAIVADSRLSHC